LHKDMEESIYFVENFSPLLRNIKGKIIALTPEVCYQFDKENIPYQTYEDFYDMRERKRYADKYHERMFLWMKDFDDYLKTKLADSLDKKINFVRLYGYYITSMIEQFIVGSKNILSVLNKEKPSKVYLVACSYSKRELNWELFIDKADLTSYLLSNICKQMNIPYAVISVDSVKLKSYFSYYKLRHLPHRIFRAFVRVTKGLHIKIIYTLVFFKRNNLIKKGRFKKILILREGWLGDLRQDAIKAGYQVLYNIIYRSRSYVFLNKRKINEINYFCLKDNVRYLWKEIGVNCIQEFNPSEWVSCEAGIDLGQILNERFLYFLQKVCPIISVTAKEYVRILKEGQIDYVVCPYKIYPSDFGAMAVATLLPEVFSVHIRHGGGEMETPLHHFTELPANIYVTPSKEEAIFYSKYFNYGNEDKVMVMVGRGWIGRYQKEADKILRKFSHSTMSEGSNRRPIKVYYLPAAISPQRLGSAYPLCWYYHLQKVLYEHFAKLSDYQFVIKVLHSRTWFFNSLLRFLKDLGAPNISYRDDDLVRNLRQAERVITDYPSSPTYEARLMGLPVLSLYYESISVRQTAKEVYGKTLVSFSKTDEMLAHIDRFLFSDPKEYIVPTKDNFSSPTILEILEQTQNEIPNISAADNFPYSYDAKRPRP